MKDVLEYLDRIDAALHPSNVPPKVIGRDFNQLRDMSAALRKIAETIGSVQDLDPESDSHTRTVQFAQKLLADRLARTIRAELGLGEDDDE